MLPGISPDFALDNHLEMALVYEAPICNRVKSKGHHDLNQSAKQCKFELRVYNSSVLYIFNCSNRSYLIGLCVIRVPLKRK